MQSSQSFFCQCFNLFRGSQSVFPYICLSKIENPNNIAIILNASGLKGKLILNSELFSSLFFHACGKLGQPVHSLSSVLVEWIWVGVSYPQDYRVHSLESPSELQPRGDYAAIRCNTCKQYVCIGDYVDLGHHLQCQYSEVLSNRHAEEQQPQDLKCCPLSAI